MNRENFFTLRHNFDGEFGEDFSDMDKKDIFTEQMQKDLDMLKAYGNRDKLLQKKVYYLPDFIDERCGKNMNIVKGPRGTFYLEQSLVPPGIPTQDAHFSFRVGGLQTGSFMGMYIVVDGDEGEDYFQEYKEYSDKDSDKVAELYAFLLSRNRNVEREGNTLYFYGDVYGANKDIEEFEKSYEEKVHGYVEYLQRSKNTPYSPVRDDETFGD